VEHPEKLASELGKRGVYGKHQGQRKLPRKSVYGDRVKNTQLDREKGVGGASVLEKLLSSSGRLTLGRVIL